jgi:hypothetical protein
MATTGYFAGIPTSDVEISYALETTWGTAPASGFKAIRLTSESLAGQKTRARPDEINTSRSASKPVTTQFTAGGTVSGAFSYDTYDDWLASLFCGAWTSNVLVNGAAFQSLYVRKKLASNLWFEYPGLYVTRGTITAAVGDFARIEFTTAAKEETKKTTGSGGAASAAPGGNVFNTVGNFSDLKFGGNPIAATVESIQLDIVNEGAAGQYGLGTPAAQGINPGVFTVGGRMRTFFKDAALYDLFVAETGGVLSFKLTDAGGNSYVIDVLNATIMNPQVVASGPAQAVMAEYQIEGSPDSNGQTLKITRAAAGP